jgi:hypothetical protein
MADANYPFVPLYINPDETRKTRTTLLIEWRMLYYGGGLASWYLSQKVSSLNLGHAYFYCV